MHYRPLVGDQLSDHQRMDRPFYRDAKTHLISFIWVFINRWLIKTNRAHFEFTGPYQKKKRIRLTGKILLPQIFHLAHSTEFLPPQLTYFTINVQSRFFSHEHDEAHSFVPQAYGVKGSTTSVWFHRLRRNHAKYTFLLLLLQNLPIRNESGKSAHQTINLCAMLFPFQPFENSRYNKDWVFFFEKKILIRWMKDKIVSKIHTSKGMQ